MVEAENAGRRPRDAHRTRAAILQAAEAVFAEHGFAGARIEVIARAAGYNTSLLFRYFGDKAGLYDAVLKKANREMGELLQRVPAGEAAGLSPQGFRTFLQTLVQTVFGYLCEHPRVMRVLTWEMAEGWRAYVQSAPEVRTRDMERFAAVFRRARSCGLLRSASPPLIQLSLIVQVCQSYLAYVPLYRTMLPGEDLSSPPASARAQELVVDFVVAGIMAGPAPEGPARL